MKNWNKFEIGLLAANVLFGVYFFITGDFSLISVLALIASISNSVCVILVAKRQISNYYWGIVGALTYGIVAYSYANTGEWMLNLIYYLPMQFVGLAMWNKSNGKTEEVAARKLSLYKAACVYILTAIGVYSYATFISTPEIQMFLYGVVSDFTFGKYIIDSMSTVLSVVALLLMINRYQEQWVLWIVVNVVSIILWFITFDITMILLWTTLLINSVYGYIQWRVKN